MERVLPKFLISKYSLYLSNSLPRDFPVPQGQSSTPAALLIVTGREPFSTLKVDSGVVTLLTWALCPAHMIRQRMGLSVSKPPISFLLPSPRPWAGMRVIFGRGLSTRSAQDFLCNGAREQMACYLHPCLNDSPSRESTPLT